MSEDLDTTEHAKYNPSSLKLWELCPSYKNREEECVNPAAEMGTRIHDALETGDPSKLINDDEIELYELTAEAVEDILKKHGAQLGEDYTVLNEVRITINLPNGDTTFGTCDKLVLSQDERFAVALDYKMGLMEVDDAEENAQVAAYDGGIFQTYKNLEELMFYLVVPRQDEISVAKFDRKKSEEQLLRVSTIIRRAKEEGGKVFNPQHNLCEFCGRQATCKALAEKALLIAKKYQGETGEAEDPFEIPEKVSGSAHENPEEVAKLLQVARLLKSWSDEVWGQARMLAFEEGWDIPGFKKIEVKTKRQISAPAAAYSLLGPKSEFNLSLDEFLECCSGIALGKLEDALKQKAPKGKKAKRCEEAEDILRDAEVLTGGDSTSWQLRVDRNYHKK